MKGPEIEIVPTDAPLPRNLCSVHKTEKGMRHWTHVAPPVFRFDATMSPRIYHRCEPRNKLSSLLTSFRLCSCLFANFSKYRIVRTKLLLDADYILDDGCDLADTDNSRSLVRIKNRESRRRRDEFYNCEKHGNLNARLSLCVCETVNSTIPSRG